MGRTTGREVKERAGGAACPRGPEKPVPAAWIETASKGAILVVVAVSVGTELRSAPRNLSAERSGQ